MVNKINCRISYSRQSCRVFVKAHVVQNRLPPSPMKHSSLHLPYAVLASGPQKAVGRSVMPSCRPQLLAHTTWPGDTGALVQHEPASGAQWPDILLCSWLPGCLGFPLLQPP